jgi:hypothetical protein
MSGENSISNEYWALLTNWMSNLTRKYFGGLSQDSKHNERLSEMMMLFLEYSRSPEFELRSGAWLMTRWLFIMPDVLYWLWLKEQGISIDDTLMNLFKPSGLVSRLRQIEVIKVELTKLGKQPSQKNIMIRWLERKPRTPTANSMFQFYNTLVKYNAVWASKKNYEHLFSRQELLDVNDDPD